MHRALFALAAVMGLWAGAVASASAETERERERGESPLAAAKKENGRVGQPAGSVRTPAGILRIVEPELVAATFGQPIRFELQLDKAVSGASVEVGIPKRWRTRPDSGLAPTRAPRTRRRAAGVRLRTSAAAATLSLDGAAAGTRMEFEIVDAGIPAGAYEIPVRWTDARGTRSLGSLELWLYAPAREGEGGEGAPNPWGSLRALNVSNNATTQSETAIAVVPNNPQRMMAGANTTVAGVYTVWISTNGGVNWVERAMPTAADVPGTATPQTMVHCCDPAELASDSGDMWHVGIATRDDNNPSRVVIARVPAGSDNFIGTVGLPERTGSVDTQDKPFATIDNAPSSPTYGRIWVVWNEPDVGLTIVGTFCDTRPGGTLNAARCDNADNWSTPVSITKAQGSFIYADVAVSSTGKVYVVWWNFSSANAVEGATCTSNCGVASSWSSAQTIATLNASGGSPVPFACPILAQPGGRAAPATSVDVDRSGTATNGRVYVTWSDLATDGSTRCAGNTSPAATHLAFDSFVASAADALPGGASPSASVGTKLLTDGEGGGQAKSDDWFPWVAVDQSTGRAYTVFLSTRHDATRRTTHTYTRAVNSAGQVGALQQVSTAQSDYSATPCCTFANDYGDYIGIDAAGGFAYPVWSDKSTGDGELLFDKVQPAQPGPAPVIQFRPTVASDSAGGDGDGIFEAGETVDVRVPLANGGTAPATNTQGTLSTTSQFATVQDATQSYGDIPVGTQRDQAAPYRMKLATLPCGTTIPMRLDISFAGGQVAATGSLPTGPAPVVTAAGGMPRAVPDPGSVNIPIPLSDSRPIGDLDVAVTIAHDFTSDMQISLTSPAGRTVELFDREGGSGDNLTNTVFDDEAQTSISGAGAPFTGSFTPSPGALSDFDGTPAAGTWTLTVTDVADPDAGQVQGVALSARFCAGAAPTPTPTPTAVPTATPTATPTPPLRPFVGLVKANASVKVKKGVFTIPVRGCAGCAGRVTVTSAKKLRVKGKRKKVKLGTAGFKIGPNGTVTVKVKLSKANQALLKKLKKIPATVALSVTNAAGQRATGRGKLTLKR